VKLALPAPEEADGSAWYTTTASTSFPAHFHDELELNLVMRGQADYLVHGKPYNVPAHSMIWFFPGRVHELLNVTLDCTMWVFSFRVRMVERLSPLLGDLGRLHDLPAVSAAANPDQLRSIARLGYDLIARRAIDHGNRTLAEVLLAAWPNAGASALQPNPQLHPAVERAVRLASDVEFDSTAGALARRCGISPTRLSHLFTTQMGVPLVHYRSHQRVQAFIRTFGDGTERGMLGAALDVGFGSYAQFHRAFRQVTGYGPRRHLERVREGLIRVE
jgi:AraC-like DNA-binding protein